MMKMTSSRNTGAAHIGLFGRPRILMGPNDDDKGGGGGGGGDPDPEAAEEAKFAERFNKLFHKAMGERESRLEKKIVKNLDSAMAARFDELKTLITTEDPEDTDDGDRREKKGDEMSPEVRAVVMQAQRDAKEAKELAQKYEREAIEAKTKSLRDQERNELTKHLTGKVKGPLLDMVVGQLHGRVVRDAEDETKILFKADDGVLLPLKDGVDTWSKSDAGKEVAPPRNAGGSGGQGGNAGHNRDPKSFGAEDLGQILSGVLEGKR